MTEIENKLTTWFFSLIGYFNHYSFFTEKLWQQVPKFGGEDEANIKCAFMHLWFHNAFGYFTAPVGMTWFHETTEELYNDYIKQYQPVFKAYEKWIEKKEMTQAKNLALPTQEEGYNSNKPTVYIVTRCEEHSDYVEKVFLDESKAQAYCDKFKDKENEYARNITKIDITL